MSKKHDYTKLDAAILDALKERPHAFSELLGVESVKNEARRLENEPQSFGKPDWRFLDSRLQALRKAGKICYSRKSEGWVLK